jgi:hypothetical protein
MTMANYRLEKGDKVRWARGRENIPLGVRDLDHVTVAAVGEIAPLALTLKEVAGVWPIAYFERVETALLHKEEGCG